MERLLLRADASARMGSGHVMRCLALALAWQARGGEALFVSHCPNEALRRRIKAADLGFVALQEPHPSPCDLTETCAAFKRYAARWLALDGYHFDPAYQQALRLAGCRLLVLDDIAHQSEYHAEVLLNQNLDADHLPYRCDLDTRLLLGPQYALLRPEFLAWRGWQREIPAVARRVLVTLGGSDPDNITLQVIAGLQRLGMRDLEIKVVVGPANPHRESLQQAVRECRCPLQLLDAVTDMPALMAWADIAISAGGSTCWELAFMGLPHCIVVLAENQALSAAALQEHGVALTLGGLAEDGLERLASTVRDLMGDAERRHTMSWRGRQMVDGQGARRVAEVLQQEARSQ